MNNTNDNVIDFPDRSKLLDEASAWIVKFEGDQPPSPEDIAALQQWLAQSSSHRQTLLAMARDWNNMDLLANLMAFEPSAAQTAPRKSLPALMVSWCLAPLILLYVLIQRGKQALMQSLQPVVSGQGLLVKWPLAASGMAAALVVAVVLLSPPPIMDASYSTALGEQANYTLVDDSKLHLNTNSRVEVVYTEGRRRIQLLQGEVHVDVAHDTNRPFDVYAGNRLVRAVGTAFSVRLQQDRVKVVVSEGKVDLAVVKASQPVAPGQAPAATTAASPAESGEVFGRLEAGQSIDIPVNLEDVMKQVQDHQPDTLQRRLAWIEGRLEFEGEPLSYVVSEVSRYTSVTIDISDPALKQLRIGGQFQIGETEALFDVLASSFNIKVQRLNEQHVRLIAL